MVASIPDRDNFMNNNPKEKAQRRAKRLTRIKAARNRKKKELNEQLHRQNQNQTVASQMYRIIQKFFPDLFKWMREIEDFRHKSEYELASIITACIAMFLFKSDSRNSFYNLQKDPKFQKNYKKLFKLQLPHPDTVNRVMKRLDEEHLNELKKSMVQVLLNRKTLHKYRLLNKYFEIAVDATGQASFDYKHCENCLHRTSKKSGKTTYFHNVLEAKLVTSNGFAISLGTEWIENGDTEYEKQDCERKAFVRLAKKLKGDFPRLPICIVADGLYPYQGFFDICRDNSWRYIANFKDGCLPTVWRKVDSQGALQRANCRQQTRTKGNKSLKNDYRWVTDIDYRGHNMHWMECVEIVRTPNKKDSSTRFVYVTDLMPDRANIAELIAAGRLRWKIENEGFNEQKNGGYNLKHKFARNSYLATKNYYQCLQIAHMINQLLVMSKDFQELLIGKMTLKHLWRCLQGFMGYGDIDEAELDAIDAKKCQIRFVT